MSDSGKNEEHRSLLREAVDSAVATGKGVNRIEFIDDPLTLHGILRIPQRFNPDRTGALIVVADIDEDAGTVSAYPVLDPHEDMFLLHKLDTLINWQHSPFSAGPHSGEFHVRLWAPISVPIKRVREDFRPICLLKIILAWTGTLADPIEIPEITSGVLERVHGLRHWAQIEKLLNAPDD